MRNEREVMAWIQDNARSRGHVRTVLMNGSLNPIQGGLARQRDASMAPLLHAGLCLADALDFLLKDAQMFDSKCTMILRSAHLTSKRVVRRFGQEVSCFDSEHRNQSLSLVPLKE